MNLDLVNKLFLYAPLAVNFVILVFFLWQINLRGVRPHFGGLTPIWKKGEGLPQKSLLWAMLFLFVFNVFYASLKTGLQYWIWKTSGPLSQGFLPPATPITYFIGYAGFRFWLPVMVSIVFALAFFSAIYFSRKKQQRFFYKGEEFLTAISILAVGWPALIVYLVLVFLTMIISSFLNTFRKTSSYTSFVYLWIPLAVFTLLFGNQIIRLLGLRTLFISGS